MKPLLALAALVMAAATLFYVTARHHRREYPMERYAEGDDGVQPADPYPWVDDRDTVPDPRVWRYSPSITVPPYPVPDWNGYRITATNSPAWERGEIGWQRPRATGLGNQEAS